MEAVVPLLSKLIFTSCTDPKIHQHSVSAKTYLL